MSVISRYGSTATLWALSIATAAHAQLKTTVTVSNNTSSPITLNLAGQPLSYYIVGTASPTPAATIAPQSTNTFVVTSTYSTTAAESLYYDTSATTQACHFNTSYTASGGYTHAATSRGNTLCDAKITSIDSTTHNYSVLFTLSTY